MSRFDYMFAYRYSPYATLTKYEEDKKMSIKEKRRAAENSGFFKLLVVLAVLALLNGVAIHYADKETQRQLGHAYQLLGH